MGTDPRVMIVEDHPLFREALEARVWLILPTARLAYVGASVDEALAVHADEPTDCVILDLDLGDGHYPVVNTSLLVDAGCRVAIVSALADPATVRACLRAGALGFTSKQSPSEEFAACFLATLAGEPSTSRDVAAILTSGEELAVPLTERERTAMVLYASGLKIDAVARRMDVKPATAQEYIKRVRSKYLKAGTSVATKTDLYRQAQAEGLVP